MMLELAIQKNQKDKLFFFVVALLSLINLNLLAQENKDTQVPSLSYDQIKNLEDKPSKELKNLKEEKEPSLTSSDVPSPSENLPQREVPPLDMEELPQEEVFENDEHPEIPLEQESVLEPLDSLEPTHNAKNKELEKGPPPSLDNKKTKASSKELPLPSKEKSPPATLAPSKALENKAENLENKIESTDNKDSIYVILQGLDKITARVFTFKTRIGEAVEFENLTIIPHYCKAAAPEDPPETTVFLEIHEKTADKGSKKIFSGWMFASSPASSAMEHPIYDVWIKGSISAPHAKIAQTSKP